MKWLNAIIGVGLVIGVGCYLGGLAAIGAATAFFCGANFAFDMTTATVEESFDLAKESSEQCFAFQAALEARAKHLAAWQESLNALSKAVNAHAVAQLQLSGTKRHQNETN